MTLFREIAKELFGMFLADARLTGGILVLVAIVAALTQSHAVEPLIGGGVLLVGCLVILVEAARRETRRRMQPDSIKTRSHRREPWNS